TTSPIRSEPDGWSGRVIRASAPSRRAASATRSSSLATKIASTPTIRRARSMTWARIGRPWRSASTLPGNRVEAKRAGITAIVRRALTIVPPFAAPNREHVRRAGGSYPPALGNVPLDGFGDPRESAPRSGGELHRLDADALAVLAHPLEHHHSVRDREESVVLSDLHVRARMDRGAVLADQDRPGGDLLSAERLHSEALPSGVTTIA